MALDGETVYWYECDVLPVVGFVTAADEDAARAAALEDAISRIGAYLEEGRWRVVPVIPLSDHLTPATGGVTTDD